MTEAFAVLGLQPTNDPRLIRGAFRRKAALLHPDRHGNTRSASDRFKRVVRAYEAALRAARGETLTRRTTPVTTPAPPAPIRERFVCPRCDDTFPVVDTCPRCELVLADSWCGRRAPLEDDPRIARLVTRLERGPRFETPELPIPEALRPWLASGAFLTGAYGATIIGLPVLGVMLGAFALAIAGLEAHDRATRPGRVRLFIF